MIYFLEQRYRELVQHNQDIVKYCQSRTYTIDNQMLNASLDMAIARFNTILLQLIQRPLEAEEYKEDIEECQRAIDKFYHYLVKLDTWPAFTHWFWRYMIHRTGTKKIPKIRALLNIVERNVQ